MTGTHVPQPPVFPGETDESDVELKDSFDWQSIRAVCIGTAPHHPAYGMSFEEYARRRSEYDDDGRPARQLTFRFPSFPSFLLPSLARRRRSQTGGSLYRYITLTLEMGLIKFQHDYHDIYSEINDATDALTNIVPKDTQTQKWLCTHVGETKINLGTSIRTNTKFDPTVADWMYGVVRQVCGDLKMTQSDLISLCVCMGVIEDSRTDPVPEWLLTDFHNLVKQFDFYIAMKSSTIRTVKDQYTVQ